VLPSDPAPVTADGFGCDAAWGVWDELNGVCWEKAGTPGTLSWFDAIDYCDQLSAGGHADWTMPTEEMFINMIRSCSLYAPRYPSYCHSCSDDLRCTGLFGSEVRSYWLIDEPHEDIAMHMDFNEGVAGPALKETDYAIFARCVRDAHK
jgi:hypothetical protein